MHAFAFVTLIFLAGLCFGSGHWIVGCAFACGSMWCLHDNGYRQIVAERDGRQK